MNASPATSLLGKSADEYTVVHSSELLRLSFLVDTDHFEALVELFDRLLPAILNRFPVLRQRECRRAVTHDRSAIGLVAFEQAGESSAAHLERQVRNANSPAAMQDLFDILRRTVIDLPSLR